MYKKYVLSTVISLYLAVFPVFAADTINDCKSLEERNVAVSPAGIYATETNPPTGYIIDFFDLVSAELCFKPFYYVSKIETVFNDVSSPYDEYTFADVGIGPLTMTYVREARADFVIFDMSPLAIMVRDESKSDLQMFISAVSSPTVLSMFGLFMLSSVVLGTVAGFSEHGEKLSFRNFGHSYQEGSWAAFQILATYTVPRFMSKTKRSRTLTKFIWATGMLLLLAIGAKFTTELIDERLGVSQYSQNDLWNKKVATKRGTFTEHELTKYTSHVSTYATLKEAVESLVDGRSDAVVHDKEMLDSFMIEHPGVKVAISGSTFAPRAYGFILPNESLDREKYQLAVLKVQESREYEIIRLRWFGDK